MSARECLYQQAILDLAKRAGRDERLEAPTVTVTVDNPLCGDRVTLDLEVAGGKVTAVGHKVRGCLLCQAATAAIAARAPGASIEALVPMAATIAEAIAAARLDADGLWPELGVFAPVSAHKSRHECVLLPFKALDRALHQAA